MAKEVECALDVLKYFPSAVAFSKLMDQYMSAPLEKKPELLPPIIQSEFMREWAQEQDFFRLDVLSEWRSGQALFGIQPQSQKKIAYKTQEIKHDFFISTAIHGTVHTTQTAQDLMPNHRHNYLELIYVAQGHYIQYIGGERHEHQQGDFCLMNPNVVHHDIISGHQDNVIFFCLAQKFVYQDLVRAFAPHPELRSFMDYQMGKSNRQYVLFHPEDEDVQLVTEQILHENCEKKVGYHLIIHGLLVRLFALLVRQGSYDIFQQDPSKLEDYLATEILQYIQQHIKEITRRQVAEHFHFNPDYINRLMMRTIGKGYSDYVHDLRLATAADRLMHTSDSVNTIIREAGYNNKGYFIQLFRERFGTTPGEYRRLNTIAHG